MGKTGKINRELLAEAQKRLDELIVLLKPCFELLIQPELWPPKKINAASIEFLNMSHERAAGFPEMFLGFSNPEIFNEEFLDVYALWVLVRKLDKLKDDVDAMLSLTGGRALETAQNFYKTLKIAARHDIPGARVLLEELKLVYPGR